MRSRELAAGAVEVGPLGPIAHDRTFFFADYQGQRQTIARTVISTVPTMLQRQGIFTEAIGGRVPVNASGGLACFGEAIPAQAIAQVCELTWQLKGQAIGRQVEGATVGVTANQGLFGHGSSVIVAR